MTAKSKIVITDNPKEFISAFRQNTQNRVIEYSTDSFEIETARDIIKEAYLTSETTKYIAITFEKSNKYSQNAMLKILEEPPNGIVFLVVLKSKSLLLPTILSRLPVEYIGISAIELVSDLDYEKFDLEYIYNSVKLQTITKDDLKNEIQAVLIQLFSKQVAISQKNLDKFGEYIEMLSLNIPLKPLYLSFLTNLFVIRNEDKKNLSK